MFVTNIHPMISLQNAFRFSGDALMLLSRYFMASKVSSSRSVSGLSLKTQLTYLIVYLLRYMDLFWMTYSKNVYGKTVVNYLQIYNSIFKVTLVLFQIYMVWNIGVKYRKSYHARHDNFPISVLIGLSSVIALVLSLNPFFLVEYCYTLSLIMESVAILPQLVMTQESEDCESMTSKYIFFLGLYRLNYFVFFFIKKMKGQSVDLLMIFTALIQTALYIDFFKVYYGHVISKRSQFKQMIK